MSTPDPSDGNPQIPVDGNSQDVKAEAVSDTSDRPFSAPSQPIREDHVQNAVNFLSHPRVKGSPVIYRRSFLEKKGLTREEIDEAFRRVPDPPSNATTVEAATTNQVIQAKSSTSVQPQAPIQTPQTAAAPVSIASVVPSSQQSKFQWSHVLIAAGVLAASGAGTALFFKNVVVPRLKTWICKVVAEENESEEDKSGSVLAEQTAEAAKAAATAAAIVAKASEELMNSKTEEKKYFEAFMGMMDVQVKEMKTMGEAIRKLESTKQNSFYQDKQIQEYIQSTTRNEKKYFEAFMGMMDVQVKEMKTMGEAIRKLESTKQNSFYQDKLIQEYIQSTTGNEKKYFEAFMGMMDVQVKEMKTMGEAIRKLESTKQNSFYQDKQIQEYIQSTTGNGTTNSPWGMSLFDQKSRKICRICRE